MLNKHNFAIAKLAPKESTTRYTLAGIQVTPDGTAVTDGHMAVTVSATPTMAQEFPFVNGAVPVMIFLPFIMRRADAGDVVKQAPKKQTMAVLDHVGIGSGNDPQRPRPNTHNGPHQSANQQFQQRRLRVPGPGKGNARPGRIRIRRLRRC